MIEYVEDASGDDRVETIQEGLRFLADLLYQMIPGYFETVILDIVFSDCEVVATRTQVYFLAVWFDESKS